MRDILGWLHWLAIGTWWVLATGFVLGVLINFTYAAQHELSHATVFKTRKLNEFFGRIIGFIQFYPRDFDQVMHFAHHTHTGNWDRDGELVREPYTLWTYFLWMSGITYWRNRVCRRGAPGPRDHYCRAVHPCVKKRKRK